MSVETPITILIADDQEIVRLGIKFALEAYPDVKVVAESSDGITAILDALATIPQVILMDIDLPKIDGIQASKQIKQALSDVRIIMLTTAEDDESVFAALKAGADGYCLKSVSPDHLYSAIKAVSRGVAWLDPGIANRVLRSPGTEAGVKSQLASIAAPGGSSQSTAYTLPHLREVGERYAIESIIGQGGMGIVYKAKHLLIDRPVAIKMLHPENAANDHLVGRFLSEAKSLSSLSHPNLVAVFDYGITASKEPYLVMEYYKGKGLDEILESGANMNVAQIIPILCQVCDALTAVHNQSIVHRDIKPSNVLISADSLVKLVDFGIAKSLQSNNLINLTDAGEVVGTPKYMSPEQCMGKELDSRSDIYSLGCVMYEAFTGQTPFSANSFYEMAQQHIGVLPSSFSLTQAPRAVSQALSEVLFQALAKDPDKRQQTAGELKEALLAAARMQSEVS